MQRPLNVPEYPWIIPVFRDYVWTCLNVHKYTRNCVNMPKSFRKAFIVHIPVVKPCLRQQVITYFNEVYGLKKQEETIFFTWRDFKKWKFFLRLIQGCIQNPFLKQGERRSVYKTEWLQILTLEKCTANERWKKKEWLRVCCRNSYSTAEKINCKK